MRTYGEKEHIYSSITNSHDMQDEIFDILEYKERYIIDAITTLARYYYETDQVIDYGAYIQDDKEGSDTINNPQYLYTLVQYEGEDVLIHIGTGEFTPEVFTRRDIPQRHGLSHSPLPLFVVSARAKQEYPWEKNEALYRSNIIRKFLNENVVIYSPKGGEAQGRIISRQGISDIDYGRSNGIIEYRQAMLILQNAIIDKLYKDTHDKEKEKFIHEIEKLQHISKSEFLKIAHSMSQKHHSSEEINLFGILKDMAINNNENDDEIDEHNNKCKLYERMYANLKMFSIKSHHHMTKQ